MNQKFKYVSDLHGHSCCSDGKCSPSEIVDIAMVNGLDIIALTDHNTMSGLEEFEQKISQINKNGIEIIGIPGIEVTTESGHMILLFENVKDAQRFGKTIQMGIPNLIKNIIKNSSGYQKYIIIPHIEIPHIGSFTFESVDKFFKDFPSEIENTGLEALNGESLILPPFLLRKHGELEKENKRRGWNRKLFGNSDYHSRHGVGVGVTKFESTFEIKTAKDFIDNIKNGTKGKVLIKKRLTPIQTAIEYAGIFTNGYIKKRVAKFP